MKFRLLIYDLDGTLLDAFEDIQIALNYGLAQCGLPTHPIEDVKRFVGDGIASLVKRALPAGREEKFDEVLPLVADYYRSHPAGTAKLYPGVKETLTALRAKGVKQAILTNKPHLIAVEACARLGLNALVDKVQGEDAQHPLKPDPRAALALARVFSAAPEDCAIVGDGKPDALLARAAGMKFVGCTWGMHTRPEIESFAPDRVIDSVAELSGRLSSPSRLP
ncbi:HAD-IA family hydrolase [Candidatus Sumerlaeota bacterium]|nr:HAD-IA family hydrolase [Candidatus Sumerlaeota bacterium]